MDILSFLSQRAAEILKQNPGMQSKIASRVAQIQAEAMVEANAQYNSELANTEKANKSAQEATSKSKLEEEIHNNRKIVSNQEPRKDVAWSRNNSFSYPNSNGSVTSNTNFSKEYVAPKYPLALSDAKNPYDAVRTEAKANANEYSELVQSESKALALDRFDIALKNKQNSLLLEESIQTETLLKSQYTGDLEWTPKSKKLSVPEGRLLPALTTDNSVFEELNKNAKFRADENVKRAATRTSDEEYAKGISRVFPDTAYTAADNKLPSTFNTSYSLPKIPVVEEKKVVEELKNGRKVSRSPKAQRYEYSITNLDDLIKNGGGQVELFNKTLNEKVPFNKFGIAIGQGEASVGYVEKDSINGAKHKGAAREAYKLLGEALSSRGIQFHDSGALLADGKKLWDSLVTEGKAEKTGAGYNYKPSTKPTGVITPDTPGSDIIKVSTQTNAINHTPSTTDIGHKGYSSSIVPTKSTFTNPLVHIGAHPKGTNGAPYLLNNLLKSINIPTTSSSNPVSSSSPISTSSTSSVSTAPKSTGSPHRPTTPINRGGIGLIDSLKGMGVYVLDVETTGLNLDDKMYSASFSKSTEGVDGKIIQNVDEHFNIKDEWKETKHFTDASGNYDREKHIRAVEAQLAKKHSSKKFGQDQKARGSLRETAEAIVDGKTNTPTDFLQQLEKSISSDKQGSVVFAHNANFEDDVFNRYNKDGTKPYKDIFSTLENRNISNSSGIMSVDDTISNKTRVEDHKGSRQRANKYYHEHLKHSIRSGDTSLIDSGLKEYASKQMDVIDDIFKSINKARATPGAYAVVDSMDLARAAMSFGALNGDVNIGNLRLGASIDTMARAWYGEEEKHTAKGDVELQRRVTNDLLTEIDAYRKNSSYRSVRIAQLNAFINKEDEATKTFQRSAINQFNRMIKSRDDTKGFADFERFLTNMKEDYDIASGNHNDRLAFLNKFNQTRNELLSNESLSIQKVKDELERIMSKPGDIDTPSAKANKVASEGFDLLEHVKSHKGKYGIGAAVVAGTLLLGGGEEGKNDKYNTYDELYNGMYYGTPFADWQERNNAHKILY